jgi:hypothetical protein
MTEQEIELTVDQAVSQVCGDVATLASYAAASRGSGAEALAHAQAALALAQAAESLQRVEQMRNALQVCCGHAR